MPHSKVSNQRFFDSRNIHMERKYNSKCHNKVLHPQSYPSFCFLFSFQQFSLNTANDSVITTHLLVVRMIHHTVLVGMK